MMLKKFSSQGQTLIELLVGIGIISVILLAMALMSTRAVQMSEVAKHRQKAVTLASAGIESVRRDKNQMYWQDFIAGVGISSPVLYQQQVFEGIFNRSLFRQMIGTNNDKVRVTVTITWQDAKGSHTINQETIIAKWD